MDDSELVEAARAARANAYAPYSGYSVGAAVRDEQGRIHAGCNVENLSYGATICAERAAIFRMVAEGGRSMVAAAVVTKDGGAPCGMCRQVMLEFSPDPSKVEIMCVAEDGRVRPYVLSELMPAAFASKEVHRTNGVQEGSN